MYLGKWVYDNLVKSTFMNSFFAGGRQENDIQFWFSFLSTSTNMKPLIPRVTYSPSISQMPYVEESEHKENLWKW